MMKCEIKNQRREYEEEELNYKIAVLPGDGIGPEVVREGTQLLIKGLLARISLEGRDAT